jgi:aminoglycoside phosphotransferase (APT) family kinase protein
MKRVNKILPTMSLVTTPEVHLFDKEANVIIMDDCGESVVSLKALLLRDEAIPVPMARTIGSALGTFLAEVHAWGKAEEVIEFFDGNTQARLFSAWATYSRLLSTLSGADKLAVLQDSQLAVSESQLAAISEIAEMNTAALRNARETIIHGDFWPGNVMVQLGGKDGELRAESIFVLDWELSKPGLPGFDVGQFCAEVHLARRFYPSSEESASAVLDYFLRAYQVGQDKNAMARVARVAHTHLAAHTIVWTPRNPTWKDRNTVEEIMKEGVRYLLAIDEEEHALSQAIFGPLLGYKEGKSYA